MAGRGPSVLNAEFVEIDGQRFPLVAGSEVQRRPLTQFAGADQIAPPGRPSKNPALSSISFLSDTLRGMGTDKHKVLDGIGTFRRGTLETRMPGGVTSPPA